MGVDFAVDVADVACDAYLGAGLVEYFSTFALVGEFVHLVLVIVEFFVVVCLFNSISLSSDNIVLSIPIFLINSILELTLCISRRWFSTIILGWILFDKYSHIIMTKKA